MQNTNLYQAIEGFDAPPNFLTRLCCENSWTLPFTRRAFAEYKRFLYLAMISPLPVTPSGEVDQVWHLHLLYTRSYWEDLCQNTLGRSLHHGPTAGGRVEDEKFENWYDRTKALYTSEFNEEPPRDFWPASEIRFNSGQRLRWLDSSRYWLIPKPSWQATLPSSIAFIVALNGVGPAVLVLAVLTVFFLLYGLLRAATHSQATEKKKGSSEADSGACSADFSSDSSDCGDSGGCSSGCGGGGCGGGD